MNSQLTALVTLICTSGVLNLYLCFYVITKRRFYNTIANFFIIYSTSISIYCFASAFGLMATTLDQIKFWTTIIYIGMPFSSPLGLLFIMRYLGISISKKWYIVLFLIPFISLVMTATNDLHHLHYRVFEIDPILGAPYIHQEIGIWYMIHGIFIFSCMFVAFFLVLYRWKETAKAYRLQLLALMFGQLVPMVTAFAYLIGLTPSGVDPVPMVLWISSLLYLWSIQSSRMFTIMPIAKDAIFNSISDGVVVLDESSRLIEFNHASKDMFPKLTKSMLGMSFEQCWFALTKSTLPFQLKCDGIPHEIQLDFDHTKRIYQVRITSLQQAQGLIIIFTDITKLKRLHAELEHQAYHDELTQIYNRRAFFEKCENEFHAAKKASLPYTILLFDIDYFKKVNDNYGHDVGDQLLKHVVKISQTLLHENVLFARYGGEEFVLALKDSTALAGEEVANLLRESLESQPLRSTAGDIFVTISCGVAEIIIGEEETLNQLLIKADKALYSAKEAGRNQVHVFQQNTVLRT